MREFDIVGKRLSAVNGRSVVTGKAIYCPDLEFPNMLVGKLLYTPYPCARIRRLDVSRAREIPGVVVILIAKDIPGENSYLYEYSDQPLLVVDQVRYCGDAIVAVAAETEEIAKTALEAIEIEYTPLEGVYDPEEAMKPDALRVWADKDNVHSHYVCEWGNIKIGFSQADLIIENVYTTQYVEHAMLETESAVAYVDYDGSLVVYASAQAPHRDRKQIARALGVPEAMVRVITPYIGGAFGAKDEAHVQIHAALLAYQSGRPVKIVRTREESIQTHVKRHPTRIRYRTGVTKEGKLIAVHMIAIGDTGPYVNAGEEVMRVMAKNGVGPYFIPNVRSESYTVLTNNPICGAFRGFGVPQVNFAFERQMDEIARGLQLDPLEIRLLNGLQTGQRFQPKAVVRHGDGMRACLERVAQLSDWKERGNVPRRPASHLRRGWGIAAGIHRQGYGPSVTDFASAEITMTPDGSVLINTGAVDMGQGAHTVLAQFVAERLGVVPTKVKVYKPDTSQAADTGPSVASRVTTFSGNAVIRAAEPIRQVILNLAAEETGADLAVVSVHQGFVYIEDERLSLQVADLAAKAYQKNLPMQAIGFYVMDYAKVHLQDGTEGYEQLVAFGAHVAQVLVDIETGQVQVEQIIAVHDVGQVINPGGIRGQINGGVAMACGSALIEELLVDQGKILNTSLESYLIPTSFDIPNIKIDVVELSDPETPLGAKGVGEPPTRIAPAAIANAIVDAIGAPITQLPITPERVLEAIQTGRN
jgi:CO/xanthine dehydrogenase Mo-binding subunit